MGGKCRFCKKNISYQYPLIEAVTAFLFWVSSFVFFSFSVRLVFASYIFVSFLILLMVSDLNWKLLPHVFNDFFIFCGLLVYGFFSNTHLFIGVSNFIMVGSVLFGFLQFFPKGLGGGDIKMMAALAIWVGLLKAAFIFVFGCVLASLVFFILKISNKVSWKWKIPFGPFLAFGAFLVWFIPDLVDRVSFALTRIN